MVSVLQHVILHRLHTSRKGGGPPIYKTGISLPVCVMLRSSLHGVKSQVSHVIYRSRLGILLA